jgi:hypothetical protein
MMARFILPFISNGLQEHLRKIPSDEGQGEQLLRARIQAMPDVRVVHKMGRGKVPVLQERAEDKAARQEED